MRKKEMANLLEERAERILVMTQRMENQNQIIDNYRAREQAIVDSLASSQAEARARIEAAQAKADALTQSAQEQAKHAIAAAEAQAQSTLAEARAQAEELLASARAQSGLLVEQARASTVESEQKAARYNALVTQTAAQMREGMEQFASFISGGTVDLSKSAAPQVAQEELPDAQGDPARLMQNIYTLQNRDIPGSVQQQTFPVPKPEAEEAQNGKQPEMRQDEEVADLAPRPEAEWWPENEAEPAEEWRPEPEPELEIPTVSELMPDEPDDELSLDALLDEIIKAGE